MWSLSGGFEEALIQFRALLEEKINILCSLGMEYSCKSMYYLLLEGLQSDFIEENEIFQGLLQVEIFLELFWRI